MKENSIPPAPSIQTFALDLGDGTKCTAEIDFEKALDAPPQQLPKLLRYEWQGRILNKHFPVYSAWVQSIWQTVADKTGKRLLLLLRPPFADPFAVGFAPNQPSKIIHLPRR